MVSIDLFVVAAVKNHILKPAMQSSSPCLSTAWPSLLRSKSWSIFSTLTITNKNKSEMSLKEKVTTD